MDLAERTCIDRKVEVARPSWLGIPMNVKKNNKWINWLIEYNMQ